MNGWTHLNSKVKTMSVTVKDLEGMFLGLLLSVCRQFLSLNFLFCEITTRVPTLWIPARLKCDVTCINHSSDSWQRSGAKWFSFHHFCTQIILCAQLMYLLAVP